MGRLSADELLDVVGVLAPSDVDFGDLLSDEPEPETPNPDTWGTGPEAEAGLNAAMRAAGG